MKTESRNAKLVFVSANGLPSWTFLTNHAQVLVCIAHDPRVRLREIGERVGITERAAHRIVAELAAAGYITRQRTGRRNHYTVNAHLPLPDAIARQHNVGQLLGILTASEQRDYDPGGPARRARPGGGSDAAVVADD